MRRALSPATSSLPSTASRSTGSNPLDLQVLRFGPGDEITLDVLRDGESLELLATLGTRPADLNG